MAQKGPDLWNMIILFSKAGMHISEHRQIYVFHNSDPFGGIILESNR